MTKQLIDLGFFTRLNMRREQLARQLLSLIYSQGRELAPEVFERRGRQIRIGPSDFEILIKEWERSYNVLLLREAGFESKIAISMGFAASGGFNTLSIWVEEEYFETSVRTEDFLQMSIAIYAVLCPAYGNIHQTRDALQMATVQDPKYGETILPTDLRKGLPGIYWANFFGLEYVEKIGRQRLLSAPCEDIRELPDGGVLILTTPSPLNPSLEVNRAKQKALRDYLGEELFAHWE